MKEVMWNMGAQIQINEAVLNAINDGVILVDATQEDLPIIYCNAAFSTITGYSLEEAVGKNCRFLQGPGTDQRELSKIREAIKQKVSCKVVLKNYRKDGGSFWNELSMSPIFDQEGQTKHFIGIVTDVREYKEREAMLMQRMLKLNIIDRVARLILQGLTYDELIQSAMKELLNEFPEYRIVFARVDQEGVMSIEHSIQNSNMPDIRGTEFDLNTIPEYLKIVRNLDTINVPDTSKDERLTAEIAQMLKKNHNTSAFLDIPLHHEKGFVGLLCFDSESVQDWSRYELKAIYEVSKFISIAIQDAEQRDERQQLIHELELKNAELVDKRELEKVNKELKDFAYVVSHDLKAPLRAISSLSSWLKTDYEDILDEEGVYNLELLNKRVFRMERLIDDILKYSKVGKFSEPPKPLDIKVIIEDVLDSLACHDCLDVTMDALPIINAHQVQLFQVFQNLISNAVKYKDKTKGTVHIGYRSLEGGGHEFSVADDGPGIPEKYFDRIFKLFQTLESRDSNESTGIGLSIVKKIIEGYGGSVWVESEVGKGTTFSFTLLNLNTLQKTS
ncbi:MAG: ATP-binding protein [Bacteroidota bacterium]